MACGLYTSREGTIDIVDDDSLPMKHNPQNSGHRILAFCGELQLLIVLFKRLQSLDESKQ